MDKKQKAVRQQAWELVEGVAEEVEARAVGAKYDPVTRELTLELKNGCFFTFPVGLRSDLDGASSEQLATFTLDPTGEHIWWDEPDAGFSVPGFLIEMVGGKELWRAWSVGWGKRLEEVEAELRSAFARKGGSAKSEVKSMAVRENGKKGGRPRKKQQAS